MAAASIVFHRLAAREYRAARDWYRQRSETVAANFEIAVDRAVARIAVNADALPVLRRITAMFG